MTMHALVKHSHAPHDVSLVNLPRPLPGSGEVIVRTEAVGLCGSDVHAWRGDAGYEWVPTPVTLGHEAVGIVEEVADGIEESWVGQRVVPISIDGCGSCTVCRTGQRQICPQRTVLGLSFPGAAARFFTIGVDRLIEVDARLPASALALTEPWAIAVHAVERLTSATGEDTLDTVVTGPGPIGVMAALILQSKGHRVTLVGTAQDRTVRLAMAEDLGLETSIGDELPDNPALWLEASGSEKAMSTALQRTAAGGTVVVPAIYPEIPRVDVNLITRREINVLGSYGAGRADYRSAAAQISADPQRWARMVTAFSFGEATKALEDISRGKVLKAVLLP
ncbi:zinc-dependent alcohol dehydrogenase [Arthrobacter subterraneus]|uniref:zinc-dependent alcohol dehydrogenase n=1 Tax=Arthrobacter subterraneus TaxID=335973 RepID=UPI00382109D8